MKALFHIMIINTIYSAHTILPGLVVFTLFALSSFNSPLRSVLFLILLLIKLNLEKLGSALRDWLQLFPGLGLALGVGSTLRDWLWLFGSRLVPQGLGQVFRTSGSLWD